MFFFLVHTALFFYYFFNRNIVEWAREEMEQVERK